MAATKKTTATGPAKKVAAAPKKTAARTTSTKKAAASVPTAAAAPDGIPAPRGTTKEGIVYTKDFDVKFLKVQHDALLAERAALTGQATRLEDEANSLIEDGEMGDVQFDDESGEGDTMVVERERDLALSAQARQTVAEIDSALERMAAGTYGYSIVSGAPIPRERLEAIPWATVLVEEKVGGIGGRR
jgi:RNA polymerase-binding transcription factor